MVSKCDLRKIHAMLRAHRKAPLFAKSTGGNPWTKGQTFGSTKPAVRGSKRVDPHERVSMRQNRINAGAGSIPCRLCGVTPAMPGDGGLLGAAMSVGSGTASLWVGGHIGSAA